MKLEEKKAIIGELKEGLSCSFREVHNVGIVFFVAGCQGCVLRDYVRAYRDKYGIDVEVLAYDENAYFAGTEAKARALKDAFGGEVFPSEFCFLAERPHMIYIWEAKGAVDLEDAKSIIF